MKRNIVLVGISLFILLSHSCVSVSTLAKRITIESDEIPPDMKTEDFTLIGVFNGMRNYDKHLEIEFAKYTGKYVLVFDQKIIAECRRYGFAEVSRDYVLKSKKEITDTNDYSDINKYRYIMHFTEGGGSYNVGGEYHSTTSARYYIIDRKTDMIYERNSQSSFFALEIRAYLMAIEAVRKK